MNLSKKVIDILNKREGKKVVFTNGCFDILHKGHVAYLQEAKEQGDFLILGLNSDTSVRKLKGEDRPINNEDDRMFVLENLKSVDAVEIFVEENPFELIKKINPDILVKGGDWEISKIIGYDIVLASGGEVKSLLFKENYSTTKIIDKLQGRK